MTKKIHLIERLKNFEKIEGRIFESGLWDVSPRTAESLVDGDIYFHEKQKEPSYFGGKILGYRIHESDDRYNGRIIFRFEYSIEHKKVSSGSGGWSNEKKIV